MNKKLFWLILISILIAELIFLYENSSYNKTTKKEFPLLTEELIQQTKIEDSKFIDTIWNGKPNTPSESLTLVINKNQSCYLDITTQNLNTISISEFKFDKCNVVPGISIDLNKTTKNFYSLTLYNNNSVVFSFRYRFIDDNSVLFSYGETFPSRLGLNINKSGNLEFTKIK